MAIIKIQLSVLRLLVVAVIFSAGWISAAPVLNSLSEIRNLVPAEAAKGRAVQVDAQVTWKHPRDRDLFLFDGEVGIYVKGYGASEEIDDVKVGDLVRVSGVTSAGGFSPDIVADLVEIMGEQPLPKARPFYSYEIFMPDIDCDWVFVAGRLLSMTEIENFSIIILEVEVNGSIMTVQLPNTAQSKEKIASIMYRHVGFNAVAGTLFNSHRQITGRIFFVSSAGQINAVDENVAAEGLSDVPIHKLLRLGEGLRKPVKTHGLVTYASSEELFLRGEFSCLKVALHDSPNIKVGDYVELEGFAAPSPVCPAFLARKVNRIATQEAPQPVNITLRDEIDPLIHLGLIDSSFSYELIEIDAQLVDVGKSFGLSAQEAGEQVTLLCRAGRHLFEARLPLGIGVDDELEPGAKLMLTGICNLIQKPSSRWRLNIDGLWIQLRSVNDIQIVVPAPWWTASRLLWIAGIALGIALLFLIWVGLLRKTVERQTGIITEKIERESVLNERQRIARELHDTLEQGLTAVSVQLRNIHRKFEKDPATGPQSVELAERMLRVCREESRASIIGLRGGILEQMDLPSAIRHTLEPLLKETPIELTLDVEGAPVQLALTAEHHLLRMVTEAANNAIRHASPGALQVGLDYGPDSLILTIQDDGCGFDLGAVPVSGRFGVAGLHERSNRLNGIFKIDSIIGQGTTVSLTMPVTEFLKGE